jgi:hypothetical protein
MAHKVIQPDTLTLNPLFAIPEGMNQYIYEPSPGIEDGDVDVDETVEFLDDDTVDESGIPPDIYIVDETFIPDESGRPEAPTDLTVVEQQVRVTATGTQYIDLVVEVIGQEGLSKYDFRVAKA